MLRPQRRQPAGTMVRKLRKRQRRSQPSGHPCRDRRTSGTSHCGSRMASCTQPCQYSLAYREEFSKGYLANLQLPFGGPEWRDVVLSWWWSTYQTSSNPSLSTLPLQANSCRKRYKSFEASRNLVKSSPTTMTTSGQTFFASRMSCSLCKPLRRAS